MAILKPCPFCGNSNMDTDEGCFPLNREGTAWEVRCGNPECCAHESTSPTRDEAIEKWNWRAAADIPLGLPGTWLYAVDEALESMELHGMHAEQSYKTLKEMHRRAKEEAPHTNQCVAT